MDRLGARAAARGGGAVADAHRHGRRRRAEQRGGGLEAQARRGEGLDEQRVHLRRAGDVFRLAVLVPAQQRDVQPLVALLQSVVRLEDDRRTTPPEAAAAIVEQKVGVPPGSLAEITRLVGCKEVPSDDARRLFPPYLDAVQRLTAYVDRWRAA